MDGADNEKWVFSETKQLIFHLVGVWDEAGVPREKQAWIGRIKTLDRRPQLPYEVIKHLELQKEKNQDKTKAQNEIIWDNFV